MLVEYYQMENPTIIISHKTRASANSDQEKSLTGVNTPLPEDAGVIWIRAVPGASDQWWSWQLQSEYRDKSCKPFQLCDIRLATRNSFISFFQSLQSLVLCWDVCINLPVLVAPPGNLASGYIDSSLAARGGTDR